MAGYENKPYEIAVMTSKTFRRRELNSLSGDERATLVSLMLPYLTDDLVAVHTSIVHFGEKTFIGHGDYIRKMEDYLVAAGAGRFVPLPEWNPANPIPEEFGVVRAEDSGTERPPLVNLNPGMPLPPRFRLPDLCEFESADALGNEINPWHIHLHTTVGGTLGQFRIASAAPIFWCFHAFISEVYQTWLSTCQSESSDTRQENLPF